jgi:hypothetical protein
MFAPTRSDRTPLARMLSVKFFCALGSGVVVLGAGRPSFHPTEPRFIGEHDAQATFTPGGSPPSFPHSIGEIVFLKAF